MKAQSIQDIKSIPFFAQFTDEQIKKHITKNAAALRSMESKSILTNKKVNGFTPAQLGEMAANYEKML